MANLKDVTKLPVVESADGLNLIVNDNGSAKQIAASAVGSQADWAEMDESNPAFIKNKPLEEWDIDIIATSNFTAEDGEALEMPIINAGSYDNVKTKILNGEIPKCKFKISRQRTETPMKIVSVNNIYATYNPAETEENGSPEYLSFWDESNWIWLALTSDGVFQEYVFD